MLGILSLTVMQPLEMGGGPKAPLQACREFQLVCKLAMQDSSPRRAASLLLNCLEHLSLQYTTSSRAADVRGADGSAVVVVGKGAWGVGAAGVGHGREGWSKG